MRFTRGKSEQLQADKLHVMVELCTKWYSGGSIRSVQFHPEWRTSQIMSWILRDEESLLGREKGRAHQAVQRCVMPSWNCKWWERVRRWSRMDTLIHSFFPQRFPVHLLWAVPWGNQEGTSAEDTELTLKRLKDSVHLGRNPQKQCFISEEEGLRKEGRWFFQPSIIFHSLVA